MSIDLSGYVEVKDRIAEFKEKYPDGRLTAEIVDSGIPGFITVKAYAHRSPDDPVPGSGLAWEPVPGKTPYTKDSELQNAETSAWGRAIVAALVADASKGVASANEVRNRQEPIQSSLDDDYACPSCGAPVSNNLRVHFGDSKQPAWKCSNKACQGGGKKKDGGNWPWASWNADQFKPREEPADYEQVIREDYPPGEEPFV